MFFSQLLIESYEANKTPKLSGIYFWPFFANLDTSHKLIWGWNPTIFSSFVPQSPPPRLIYLLHKPEHMQVVLEIKILLAFLVNNNKKNFCKMEVYKMAGICYLKTTGLYLNLIIV